MDCVFRGLAELLRGISLSWFEYHRISYNIEYSTLELQPYLRSANLHPEEIQTITALRSNCVKSIRSNFSKMYKNRLQCPLNCTSENPQIDTQDHLLACKSLKVENPSKLTIQLVYSDIAHPEAIGKLICKALKQRKKLLENNE